MIENRRIKILKICFVLLMLILIPISVKATEDNNEENQVLYLSDINYLSGKTAWGSILYDKTSANSLITVNINGAQVSFKKGIWAHATSTVVYNISDLDYDYFSTYYGVATTSGNAGNGVKFYIYTSADNNTWTLQTQENPSAMMSSYNAGYIKLKLKNESGERVVNYIKLYAHDNGANGNDHSVYPDAKLFKEGYKDNIVKTVEEYDEEIKNKYESNNGIIDEELELLILQRELVKNAGQYQIKSFFEDAGEKKEQYEETFNWLFNNVDILRLYIAGGKPDGTYLNSFKVLSDLYTTYKEDLNSEETTVGDAKLSDVYLKMIISLSLTHSRTVNFWINSSAGEPVEVNPNVSFPTKRYAVYKDMMEKNKLHTYFYQLEVEEMRFVMNSMICDDEIEWLRDYIISSGKQWRSAYQFMSYKNVNTALYRSDIYYGQGRDAFKDKYKLEGYDIANVKYYPKTFIVMQVGGVCWQISNVGQTMCASYGVPSVAVGQPSHVAYLVYDIDSNGNSTWTIWNNVGGWQVANLSNYTGNRGSYKVRLLNGWGSGNYASNNCGTYILLAQAALDDYDNYVKSKEKILLGDSFVSSGDKVNADKLYREAIETQKVNIDAYINLINLHANEKDGLFGDYNEDLYEIAELAAENLKYYPLPVYDVLRLINGKMTDSAYKSVMMLLEKRTLTDATKATYANTVQFNDCKTMANYLLGQLNLDTATFSFDTEDGAKISLSSVFDSTRPNWDYSLDGGTTWIDVDDGNSVILTSDEIASITADDDILVHFIGVNYDEKNLFRIDIKPSLGLPNMLYANDWENKFIDSNEKMEWKLNNSDEWTSFKKELPNLSGDKTVSVRMGATGTYLASESKEFTFTKDSEDLTKSYLSIDHLSVTDFSSETVRKGNDEQAIYAIDGNMNKFWHTSRTSTTDERYIVVKLDKPRYISQMQYIPVQNYDYGVMKNGMIWTSLDGKTWTETYEIQELVKDNSVKTFEFEESVYTQYIKLKCTKSYDYLKNASADWFLNVAMLNFYEDLTKSIPTAEIEYSRNQTTALSVTAKLVNASEDITITNNNGSDKYTFTENGEFIFEFQDKVGNKGSAKATVDWIVDYSFAFDGEDPNTIIMGSKYNDKSWSYSIDGGNTWKETNTSLYKLSDEEIAAITASDDIKIRISDDEIITIDILESENLPTNLYANDYENKILGATDTMEWRMKNTEKWTSYKEMSPDLAGNKIVEVRIKAIDKTLCSDSSEYEFTDEGENDDKYKYITIDNLSVKEYSSQTVRPGNNEPATNAIDGYRDTFWMTNRVIEDNEKYIVIELKEPKYISKVQYVPGLTSKTVGYGVMTDGIVYTSTDGEHWTEAIRVSELDNDDTTKDLIFNETRYAKYIKLQATHTAQPNQYDNQFLNASMINIFEDITNEFELTLKAIFSTEEPTDQDVTVQLIATNATIKILNNGGSDTYTFTENGSFTFEYEDEYGNKGTYKVEVTWIEKGVPTETPEITPTPTSTPIVTPTTEPSPTITPTVVPTSTPVITPTIKPSPTITPTIAPTSTPSTTLTPTSTPTETPVPTASFETYIISNKDQLEEEDEFEISFNIRNLNNIENGLLALSGTLEYDEEILELLEINGETGWVMDENSYNEQNFKFITDNDEYINEDGCIFKISLKVKESENLPSQTIFKIKDIIASNGIKEIVAEDTQIILKLPDFVPEVFTSEKYEIGDNYITKILPKTTVENFKENVTTNQDIVIKDKDGNILKETDEIGTGMKIEVGENIELILVVTGDTDGDGEIGINDLARIKMHSIDLLKLENEYLKSADLDFDEDITINDIAMIKLVLIGKTNIEE